jgi:hypothetical protein
LYYECELPRGIEYAPFTSIIESTDGKIFDGVIKSVQLEKRLAFYDDHPTHLSNCRMILEHEVQISDTGVDDIVEGTKMLKASHSVAFVQEISNSVA